MFFYLSVISIYKWLLQYSEIQNKSEKKKFESFYLHGILGSCPVNLVLKV